MTVIDPIQKIAFQNPRWPGLGLEVLWLSRLWRRIPVEFFSRPERRDFHVLLLCTAGSGRLHLDFTPLELNRGSVVHLRPGEVIQHPSRANLEARAVLFLPEFLSPEAADLDLPTCLGLQGPEFRLLDRAFAELHEEYAKTDGSPEAIALLKTLLDVILRRIAMVAGHTSAPPERPRAQVELLRQFRRELEAAFRTSRHVSHYAKRLGYAEKTLNRAAKNLEGLPAKALIEARVLLEARRLLVHTRLPICAIAQELGFSEPTNFAKFFRKGTGLGPSDFRRSHLGE